MKCPTTVHETVCVQAKVTITPKVDAGEIKSFCVGEPIIRECPGETTPSCTFTVSQRICVEVPLDLSAHATVEPLGIVCDSPEIGTCPATPCTHSIGFYANNPDTTNALIVAAGGAITLGSDNLGLSFTVTTANAGDVLSFNTLSPPAPSSPPFRQQYQILYAQLLAANLNVLSGATCDAATTAITTANTFLATSPSGGMAGAPGVQSALAQYNEGDAPGCPGRCR